MIFEVCDSISTLIDSMWGNRSLESNKLAISVCPNSSNRTPALLFYSLEYLPQKIPMTCLKTRARAQFFRVSSCSM